MCGICDIENIVDVDEFSEEDFDRIIRDLVAGVISIEALDYFTYLKNAQKLTEGVFKGYGKAITEVMPGSVDYEMLFELRQNVHIFSAAKVYQQTAEMQSILMELGKALTKDDKIVLFGEFEKQAKEILTRYNKTYLKVEYNAAIGQSQNASKWVGFEKNKHLYPNLTYHTVGDDRVRPTHAILDGITRPVGDPFWKKYAPMNGWGCRCVLLQSDEEEELTNVVGFKQPEDVPDAFMFNPGTDKIVFSNKHPYFEIAPKDRARAKQNFGFPLST